MDARQYLHAIGRRWVLILVLAVAGLLGGVGAAATTTPTYQATTTVFLSPTGSASVRDLAQGATYIQNLAQSLARLSTLPVVLDPVIARLGLKTSATGLAPAVQAQAPLESTLVTISVSDPSASRAATIANAIGKQLTTGVKDLSPGTADAVDVTVVAAAQVPSAPVSPNRSLDAAAGLLLGLALGLLLAIGRELVDPRVSSVADLAALSPAAVLGQVQRAPRTALDPARPLDTSPWADGVRRLAGNVLHGRAEGLRTLMLTSAGDRNGSTQTTLGLAAALAERGLSVLVVDADPVDPQVAGRLLLPQGPGLAEVLTGRAQLTASVLAWAGTGVHVLTAGSAAAVLAARLGSPAGRELLAQAARSYDVVLLAGSAVTSGSGAVVLGQVVDGVLVDVDVSRTRRSELERALAALELAGAPVLGLVLDQLRPSAPRARRRHRRLLAGRRGRTTGQAVPLPATRAVLPTGRRPGPAAPAAAPAAAVPPAAPARPGRPAAGAPVSAARE